MPAGAEARERRVLWRRAPALSTHVRQGFRALWIAEPEKRRRRAFACSPAPAISAGMSDEKRPFPKKRSFARPAGGDRQGFRPRPKRERSAGDSLWLYGLHTVELALKNPRRRPVRLLATKNALMRLHERFEDGLPLAAEDASPMALDKLLGSEAVHQGVALEVEPLEALRAADLSGFDLVLALDQITDPHNVGAILRSACALGVGAVVTTARHSPPNRACSPRPPPGAGPRADDAGAQSRRRPHRTEGRRLPGGRPRFGGAGRAGGDGVPGARSASCSGRRAKACASAPARSATCSRGSTCRARSRASTSPTPACSRSTWRGGRSGALDRRRPVVRNPGACRVSSAVEQPP